MFLFLTKYIIENIPVPFVYDQTNNTLSENNKIQNLIDKNTYDVVFGLVIILIALHQETLNNKLNYIKEDIINLLSL